MLRPHGVVVGRGSAVGNVFRIQPPMCIEEKNVNYVVDVLEELALLSPNVLLLFPLDSFISVSCLNNLIF